ncbi:MAG: hypothetical protein R6V61_09395 [Wenzhouxiangellaceae bacterium]
MPLKGRAAIDAHLGSIAAHLRGRRVAQPDHPGRFAGAFHQLGHQAFEQLGFDAIEDVFGRPRQYVIAGGQQRDFADGERQAGGVGQHPNRSCGQHLQPLIHVRTRDDKTHQPAVGRTPNRHHVLLLGITGDRILNGPAQRPGHARGAQFRDIHPHQAAAIGRHQRDHGVVVPATRRAGKRAIGNGKPRVRAGGNVDQPVTLGPGHADQGTPWLRYRKSYLLPEVPTSRK